MNALNIDNNSQNLITAFCATKYMPVEKAEGVNFEHWDELKRNGRNISINQYYNNEPHISTVLCRMEDGSLKFDEFGGGCAEWAVHIGITEGNAKQLLGKSRLTEKGRTQILEMLQATVKKSHKL